MPQLPDYVAASAVYIALGPPVTFDPSRSTPAGYWHLAAQYFHAAQAVSSTQRNLMFPALQLYGQSLELALKAFLLKRGATLSEVNGMRHRLAEILKDARRRRLGTQVKLSKNDIALINLLSQNYESHRFRYIVTGFMQVPDTAYIARVCKTVLVGLEKYCTGSEWGLHR